MTDEIIELHEGDRVRMRPKFGMGDPIEVDVARVGENWGEPIFDYVGPDGHEHWANFHQVEEVLERAADKSPSM